MLATATNNMHMFESGVAKYVAQQFIASMSTNVQASVNFLLEKMFVAPLWSSRKKDYPRTNFSGGATSLTMLSSHHWPGMLLAFLLVLLTPEGKEACKNCFADDDCEEPDIDWDDAYL